MSRKSALGPSLRICPIVCLCRLENRRFNIEEHYIYKVYKEAQWSSTRDCEARCPLNTNISHSSVSHLVTKVTHARPRSFKPDSLTFIYIQTQTKPPRKKEKSCSHPKKTVKEQPPPLPQTIRLPFHPSNYSLYNQTTKRKTAQVNECMVGQLCTELKEWHQESRFLKIRAHFIHTRMYFEISLSLSLLLYLVPKVELPSKTAKLFFVSY